MDLELKGKTALVTGASYGLGFACAMALAAEGVDIAVVSRDREKIESAAMQLRSKAGIKANAIAADLTDSNDLSRIFKEAETFLGSIDILCISTGHPPTYSFSQATDEHWKKGIELVLEPPMKLTRLALAKMRERQFGRVIFIGSIFGLEAEQTSVVQSTLRTGLNALTKCIATEVAADGITVNVICPGYFDTPLVQKLAKQYATAKSVAIADVLEDWKSFAPVKKFGKPEDLGSLVAFLASPRAQFITGTAITIDGGAIRQY